jgi:hypothetical protein
MCKLLSYTYTRCNHTDRSPTKGNATSTDKSRALTWLQYCPQALREADEDSRRTTICGGQKKDELENEYVSLEGFCTPCFLESGLGEGKMGRLLGGETGGQRVDE